jgi:hypothetical protein
MANRVGLNLPVVHLQGLGTTKAKPAGEFQVGEYTMWNYGYQSRILHIQPKGRTQLKWRVLADDGKEYDRTVKTSRLVAIGLAGNFPERLRTILL